MIKTAHIKTCIAPIAAGVFMSTAAALVVGEAIDSPVKGLSDGQKPGQMICSLEIGRVATSHAKNQIAFNCKPLPTAP